MVLRNESAKSKFVEKNYVVLLTCTCKLMMSKSTQPPFKNNLKMKF